MLKNATIFLTVLFFLPIFLGAQNKAILKPGGESIILKSNVDAKQEVVTTIFKKNANVNRPVNSGHNVSGVTGTIDTLKRDWTWSTTSFGVYGQDVFAAWFVAPADLIIKSVGIDGGDNPGNVAGEVKLYKIGNGWTKEMLQNQGDFPIGYWISKNGNNDIAPFEDEATEPKTWVAHQSGAFAVTPFAQDIWSDAGTGAPIILEADGDVNTYQWIDMNQLVEPTIASGEIFAVILKNNEPVTNLTDRFGCFQNNSLRYGLLKFHATPRTAGDTSTAGWWMRSTLLNFAVIVDLVGDQSPIIEDVTDVQGTLETGPIEISATLTDENPGGGAKGIKEAFVVYSTDVDTVEQEASMSLKTGDEWAGSIPGQTPGTVVTYKIKAVDVADNITISDPLTYTVFKPTAGVSTLVTFNGISGTTGYPQDYYVPVPIKYDIWAFGPASAQLLNNYTNIIEIASNGPNDINSDEIKAWLDASPTHNYMLIGDEWLGSQTNWTNTTYEAGSFQYDVLGIVADSNDVNYDASGDQNLASLVYPVQGTLLGDSLYQAITAAGEDSLLYNPYYETGYTNWLDGVIVREDVVVDIKAKGISGEMFNIGIHRTLPAGNKIVFLAFDPLALDANPPYTNANYVWYGYSTVAPHFQALNWFGVPVSVDDSKNATPNKYNLSQNYPNPFNPTTNIKYSIPVAGNVTLKVFDMLGKEVATLVNGYTEAGTFDVTLNASNLSSGLYIYKLNAGDYSISKKMMLLK